MKMVDTRERIDCLALHVFIQSLDNKVIAIGKNVKCKKQNIQNITRRKIKVYGS